MASSISQVAMGRQKDMSTRRLVVLVLCFVVTPTAMMITVGVLILVLGSAPYDTLFGVLILSTAGTVSIGVIATLVFAHREANLAKMQTEFISKVSHDLRTPLTSIRMFIDTLKLNRIRDPERLQQCLEVLSTETARLTGMINRLLQWGRMEAGKRIYSTEPEGVDVMVDAALAAFEPQMLEHPVKLNRSYDPDLPLVMMDLAAMSEALLNLLQNAFRYTGEDKEIAISCLSRGGQVEIRIGDNGPGIPQVEHKRIFEKFYRTPEARMRNMEGSGLGLAMVRHIVQAHRGRITLESEVGQGSTFIITLPAHKEE